MPLRLSPEIIEAAIAGFEQRKQQTISQIDSHIAELRAMLPGSSTPAPATTDGHAPAKRRHFSAAARQKMALAQKARWARIHGESQPAASSPEPAKPKRRLSAAGRKRIQEALRKRWAQKHAEAAKATPARSKAKTAPARKAVNGTAPVPVAAAQSTE